MMYGKLIEARYRSIGAQLTTSVVRVYFDGPNGVEYHDIPNDRWLIGNPSLQFMAVHGLRPSDFGPHGRCDLSDKALVVPVDTALDAVESDWGIHPDVWATGEAMLKRAAWFDGDDSSDDGGDSVTVHLGGGDADPSTGNEGYVGEPSEVDADA